ncbi:MAG: phosphate ABC transporter permease subunit PstC [Candidatus Bathyarchaeia archaeon]
MKLKESTLQKAFLKDSLTERLAKGLFLLCAFAVIFVTLLITIFLFKEGIPALIQVPLWEIFSGTVWQPSAQVPKFGILPLVTGSTIITVTTLILATPIGVGIALYLSEFSHPLEREVLKPLVELLAAIPSVVFGFFALTVVSSWIHGLFRMGTRLNALNGILVLSLMVLPTIASISEDALNSVPRDLKEAAYALGATKLQVLKRVVLPYSGRGILVAILLAFGRAIGETMAVLMATGNAAVISLNLLTSMETMTAAIAIEMGEVVFGSLHYQMLFLLGIILFLISTAVNLVADYLVTRGKVD